MIAALGAVIGHKLQQRRIARPAWAEQQRQRAWAEYYARQAAPRWHTFVAHPDGTVEEEG